ncbi:hypothetical protein [Actinomycetospora flava]|uniref:Uncharacterized protein n=1 Tax=Actinomycetospora flava TaxID=3129232 RepID=A0ABU8M565_9PSEU
MGAHTAPSTLRSDRVAGIAGRGALTAAAAIALVGGGSSMAFATPADLGHDDGPTDITHEAALPVLGSLPGLPALPSESSLPGAHSLPEVQDQVPAQVQDEITSATSSTSEDSEEDSEDSSSESTEASDDNTSDVTAESDDSSAPGASSVGILNGIL